MIIAAADDEALLGPNDLGTDIEALANETFGHRRRVEGTVPDVDDVTRKQRPSAFPICPLDLTDFLYQRDRDYCIGMISSRW